jgi:hypothetical protein
VSEKSPRDRITLSLPPLRASSTSSYALPAVIVVRAKRMKEPWYLVTSLSDRRAGEIVKL